MGSIFNFAVRKGGEKVLLQSYAGHVTLVVNTASLCSFTHANVDTLNKIQALYAPHRFTVLAFPCAQFANQEPLSDAEIAVWADGEKVSFPVFDKVNVKGSAVEPLFAALQKELGPIRWNYTKFICNREGIPCRKLDPSCSFSTVKESVHRLVYDS